MSRHISAKWLVIIQTAGLRQALTVLLSHTHAQHLGAGRSTLILFTDLDNEGLRSAQIAYEALLPSQCRQSPFKVGQCTRWPS